MYKIRNKLTPNYLSEPFKLVSSVYDTRHADGINLSLPKTNLEIFKQSLSYKGVVIWNNLPYNLQNSTSIEQLQNKFNDYF